MADSFDAGLDVRAPECQGMSIEFGGRRPGLTQRSLPARDGFPPLDDTFKMAEKQHIVPEFFLRRFANDADLVRVFPRDGGEPFVSSVERIARETDFYMLDPNATDGDNEARHVEDLLSELETEAAQAIERVVAGGFPPSADDRLTIVTFISFQFTRGWGFRRDFSKMVDASHKALLKEGARHNAGQWLREQGAPYGSKAVREFVQYVESEEYEISFDKNYGLGMMLGMALEAALPFVIEREWRLYEFHDPCLLTSDEPVGLWVRPDRRAALPAVGVATADVIFLALDPHHALALAHAYTEETIVRGEEIRRRQIVYSSAVRARRFAFCRPDTDALAGMELPEPEEAAMETISEKKGRNESERILLFVPGAARLFRDSP